MYRGVLAAAPDHPDALNLLGALCLETARLEEAEQLVARALAVVPSQPNFHLSLGNVLRARGRADAAVQAWQRAVQLAPDLVEAHANLAATFTAASDGAAAERAWREVVRLTPGDADASFQLGQLLASQGRFNEAIEQFQRCVRLSPTHFVAYNALGVALSEVRDHAGAAAAFARAAELSPRTAPFHMNLGQALRALERDPEAEAAFRKAIELSRAVLGGSYHGLAAALRDQGKLREAATYAHEAVRVLPEFASGYHNLGNIQYDAGLIDEATASYRQVIELDPSLQEAHGSLLLLLHYKQGNDAELLWREHRAWARRHTEPLGKQFRPQTNNRDPERRLRVGYLSADFRAHPVGFSIEPIFAAHDRNAVEIIAYNNRAQSDPWTQRIRAQCALWHEVRALSDERFDQLVRDDRIDILVDLAGHTAGNRLLVFARRPAPVQMTYLGYPDTTGMSAMDCKLTDAWQDPVGQTDPSYSEKLIRLPGGAWCFRPREIMPPVGPLPADFNGFVTFLSANRIAKVTDEMLDLWRTILGQAPDSRLLILTGGDDAGERRVRRVLHDMDPARVELVGRLPPEKYFQLYSRSDIALDTFPYNGYMTTCDALWMGVPVVTLSGRTHVTRTGVSLLSKVGLTRFVCNTPDEYADRAVAAAADRDALRHLRGEMRQRLTDCGLIDGARLAREIEAAYRQMWRQWCERCG